MRASILGLGQWLPSHVRGNDAWPADFGQARASAPRELTEVTAGESGDACDRITARYVAKEAGDPFLGAVRRRIADEAMMAADAEAEAGRAALEDARIDAKDVGLVLSWAAVPDHIAPSSAPRVAHRLGIRGAAAFAIDAACATTLAQIDLAASMIESGRVRYALLTQSHLITRAFALAHPASPNVGDAATAIVVGATERRGILATHLVSEGEYYDAVAWRRPNEASHWWQPGEATYLGSFAPEQARWLIQNTVRVGASTVRETLAKASVPASRVNVLASVQPRQWIPAAIAEALGLSLAIAPDTFAELAHLGGCGVVTNLLAARSSGLLRTRDEHAARSLLAGPEDEAPQIVALYAQGAGFIRGATLLAW